MHRVRIGVEIGGVYLPSQLERSHNFVRDGRYSERGGRGPPTLTSLGKFFHHDGMYATKWSLPLYVLYGHNKKIHRVQRFINISPVLVCICGLHVAVYCADSVEAGRGRRGSCWSLVRYRCSCAASVEAGVEAAGVLVGCLFFTPCCSTSVETGVAAARIALVVFGVSCAI